MKKLKKRKYEIEEIHTKINHDLAKKKGTATLFVCSRTMSIQIKKQYMDFVEKLIQKYELNIKNKKENEKIVSYLTN